MEATPSPRTPVRPPPLPVSPNDHTDRRRAPRASFAVEVSYRSGHNFYAGRTRDLSEGGLFLECRAKLASGDLLTVDLRLMKHTFSIACEVAWVLSGDDDQTVGVGVRFLDLGDEARTAIQAFMVLRDPMDFVMTD